MINSHMDADELKNTADQHLNNGQLAEALTSYTSLCKLQPKSAHAWHMRAAVHGMLGQFQDCVVCCEKALSINPNVASIYSNYASALVELTRFDDAIQAFRHALEINPTDVDSLAKLANLYTNTGNLTQAENYLRKILEINPGAIEAATHLAHILKESGDIPGAIETCEYALSYKPTDRVLLITQLECCFLEGDTDKAFQRIALSKPLIPNLSNPLYRICKKLHDSKQYQLATRALQTILNVFPDDDYFKLLLADCQVKQQLNHDALSTLEQLSSNDITLEAQVLLADIYTKTDQPEKAEHQLVDAVRQHPDQQAPVALLARSFSRSKKHTEAQVLLEQYLKRHPDAYKILVELGTICELKGEHTKAKDLYKRSTSVEPEYAIAHSRLGVLYQNEQQYDIARDHFKKAIHCDPALLLAQCSLAYLYCSTGEYSKAQEQYDKVLDIDPHFEAAIAGKATVLERVGELTASFRLIEPLVESGAENIHTLLAYAHACSVDKKESTAAALIERALGRTDVLPNDRMHACFMLGKLLDRLGEFDRAFLSYQRGNELNRFPFDRSAHQRLTDAILAVFSAENIKIFPESTNQTNKPVFIIGMPRSGTTLTEQILASHPDVFGAGELSYIRGIATGIAEASGSPQPYPLCMPAINQAILDKCSFEHLQTLESLADGQPFITDKMPSNFMFLGLIERLFPNARILHCVRDPIDTCLSCYFQNFSRGQYFSYNQSDLAFYYNQYKRVMAHWKSTLSIPIMDIPYEQMVDDQEHISRKMIEFIGLEWHPDCLDFHNSGREIRTASYDQVRKPVYSTSVKRWEKYQSHLVELRQLLSE